VLHFCALFVPAPACQGPTVERWEKTIARGQSGGWPTQRHLFKSTPKDAEISGRAAQ